MEKGSFFHGKGRWTVLWSSPREEGMGKRSLFLHMMQDLLLRLSASPPTCSLGVETEIYFNDSLKPNCIQPAIQRKEPPTCGSTTVRRALKASPKAQGRQTDCLFSAGPDSRDRCWLWSSAASWSGSKKTARESLCSSLHSPPSAQCDSCRWPLIPELPCSLDAHLQTLRPGAILGGGHTRF